MANGDDLITNLPLPRIDYTARDFESLRQALIQHIKENHEDVWTSFFTQDLGIVMLNVYSYVAAQQAYYLDRNANEGFLPTATERQSAVNIGKKLGYVLSPPSAASGDVTATLNEVNTSEVRIAGGTLVEIDDVPYEVDRDYVVPAGLNPPEISILLVQGRSTS